MKQEKLEEIITGTSPICSHGSLRSICDECNPVDNDVEMPELFEPEPEPMRIYVSGKINNLPYSYVERQFKWAIAYIARNYNGFTEILSPLEINPPEKGNTHKQCMMDDIYNLWDCHAIAMLPSWEHSLGARIEHAIAKELNLLIYYLPMDFDSPGPI